MKPPSALSRKCFDGELPYQSHPRPQLVRSPMPRTGYSAWRRRNIGAPNKKLDYGLICGDHRYPYWLRRLDFERTIAVFWIDNHEIMQNRVGKEYAGDATCLSSMMKPRWRGPTATPSRRHRGLAGDRYRPRPDLGNNRPRSTSVTRAPCPHRRAPEKKPLRNHSHTPVSLSGWRCSGCAAGARACGPVPRVITWVTAVDM